MNFRLKLFYIIIILLISVTSSYAQNSGPVVDAMSNVSISYGNNSDGSPFRFNVEVPALSQSWTLTISEFNGRKIFQDTGLVWDARGYTWEPKNVELYSSIYYVVTISFSDANKKIIKTAAKQFFIPTFMKGEKTPLFFFDGDTIDTSKYLYKDNSIMPLIKYISNQANTEFADDRILLRGHAAFVSALPEDRQKEQMNLLELSRKRALKILDLLVQEGVDSTRIFYEAFGGSAEISQEEEQRWKNRRVEVIFVDDIDNITKDDSQDSGDIQQPDIEENTIADSQMMIKEPQMTVKLPMIDQDVEPWPDIPVLGLGQLQANHMVAFILYYTPTTDETYIDYLRRIVMLYINESRREGVNHDIAFAQMILETNYLRFSGQVRREQNNFAGIGAINDANQGNWFSTEVIGVRAHVQHLKGYATTHPLRGDLVDPRYAVLERLRLLGSSPLVSTLSGRWATDPEYGKKILVLLRKMYNYANALMSSDY